MIVEAALQEDVDAIGLSLLSGAHMTVFPRVARLMQEQGLDDIMLFGGGIIADEDTQKLNEAGVSGIFGPGTSTQEIIAFVEQEMARRGKVAGGAG